LSADNLADEHAGHGDLLEVARSLSLADTHLDTPPADLWAGIEARVAARRRTGIGSRVGAPVAVHPIDLGARATVPGRRSRAVHLVGAAAALVAAVVGLLAFVGHDSSPVATALDSVTLSNEGLAPVGATSAGRATLVTEADGRYALDVEISRLPAAGNGFFELWIIDRDVHGMYSLGPLHGSGHYALPDHVAPANFPIVDVSIEPSDGVPAHSGISILRGTLTI
jgi:hypothetical protein